MEAVITLAIISLAVGFAVGVLAGLLGVGGGVLLVPIFRLGYAMDSLACTATSLFTIIPTSISGAASRIRNKTCVPKLGIAAGLGGACTSPVGVWLATQSPDWLIMGAAALVIAYSSLTMFRKALAAPKTRKPSANPAAAPSSVAPSEQRASSAAPSEQAILPDATPSEQGAPSVILGERSESKDLPAAAAASEAPAAPTEEQPTVTRRQLLIFAAIGLVAGLASGYVGVGGGFIMVPMMMSLAHLSMRYTSGTSLIAVMILAVPGVITQALLGNIDWVAGIAVACGSIPGAMIGARFVPKIPERQLRFLFAGFLIVAAIMLVIKQVGL